MGKHSAPAHRKHRRWRRHKTTLLLSAVLIFALAALAILLLSHDPYREFLEEQQLPFSDCETIDGVPHLTFAGDAEGILACRAVLNALRTMNPVPSRMVWTLKDGETDLLSGTAENLSFVPSPDSPRVETLEEDLTVLKLKYELEQSGLLVYVAAEETVGIQGKTLSVTVECTEDGAKNALKTIPSAIQAVNDEGGGIVRCNILFTDYGELFAAASYDFYYGDTLLSSLLSE